MPSRGGRHRAGSPDASPRRVVCFGFLALLAGVVVFLAALDAGAGPEITTWPMLLAVELAAGIPFVSDADLEKALDEAVVPDGVAEAITDANTHSRIRALRAPLAVLALLALLALAATGRIPERRPLAVPD